MSAPQAREKIDVLDYLLSKFPYWYAVCASKNDRVETIFQKNNIKTLKSWSDYKITPYFQICLKSDQDLLSRGGIMTEGGIL